MALPWPTGTPTLPRIPAFTPRVLDPTERPARSARVDRLLEIAASPVTALVVMLVGLALLFVLPLVGLPFVALVVLPAVIYQLSAERRSALRLRSRR